MRGEDREMTVPQWSEIANPANLTEVAEPHRIGRVLVYSVANWVSSWKS